MGSSYASGYHWYLWNFFGKMVPAQGATLNIDGSISLMNPNSSNAVIATAGLGRTPGTFVGRAFGGGGYFEAEIEFDPGTVEHKEGWPAWWGMSIEHLVDSSKPQWPGQPNGYMHFIEVDPFEYDKPERAPNEYGAAMRDWFGIYRKTCPEVCNYTTPYAASNAAAPIGVNWKTYHDAAMLWVPATRDQDGYISFYFDGLLVGGPYRWRQFTDQAPPVTGSTPWRFGIIDQQHIALILGSGSGPMRVRAVRVWQKEESANLVH
jgi:hypothetical protein